MSDKIKEILAKRRNPDLAVLTKVEDIRNDAIKLIDKAVTERFSALEDQIKTLIDNKETKSDQDLIEQTTLKLLKNVKGDKGDSIKGDDGHTPTDKELLNLIKPLIPVVKDGKTPTSEEILALIKPLIPQVKDGATPTREELLSLIMPLIPEPIQGEQGKDGKEIEPEEISKKLNTLEEKVEMKVIKGLKAYLKKLETNIFYKGSGKSGGGGMGQPQHETFAVDSTTTSITTSYEIAADGRAIFGLRYQGQTLHWGEHYTVSGKTITILETLGDNTNLDITYIRK